VLVPSGTWDNAHGQVKGVHLTLTDFLPLYYFSRAKIGPLLFYKVRFAKGLKRYFLGENDVGRSKIKTFS